MFKPEEEILRFVLDVSQIGIYVIQDRRFKLVNPEMSRITGYSQEELLRMDPMELVHPEDRDMVRKNAIKLLKGERKSAYEFRSVTKDGKIKWIMEKVAPIQLRGRMAIIGNFMDITRRKKIEQQLKETKETLQKILDASPIGIVLAEDRVIKWANKGMVRLFGYERIEDFIELPAKKIYVSEEEYKRVGNLLYEVLKKEEIAETEVLFKRKDGSPFWGLLRIAAFDPEHPEKRIIATVVDITERKRLMEELFQETELFHVTLMSIGDGVICTDTQGRITLINKTAEELTGWKKEEAIGKPLSEVFYIVNEFTKQRCDDPVKKVLETGRVVGLANHTILISKDGKERVLADSGAPIRDKKGNIIGVVLVFRDITEQRLLEKEMQRLERLEAIGVLAGGIAHDFNNLLMGMLGNVNLIKNQLDPENRAYKYIEELERVVIQAKSLTQQLLTFSKGGSPVRKPTNLKDLIQKTTHFVLSGSNIETEFDIPDELPPANVDEAQIAQVISNIVINARQAMPAGGKLVIKAEEVNVLDQQIPSLKPGHYIKLIIQDTGIGIPKEHINRIFDPYFTTKQKGSGLGLTVVYSIIKNHEGYITVDSELGKGTTFEIYLPAVPKKEKKILEPARLKILVMDDEEIVLEVIQEMLKILGHEAIGVRDGKQAIEVYKEAKEQGSPFDVVILDLTVPTGMGGEETMKELLKIDPDVKAIVSSGYSNDPIMSEYEKYGFKAVVPKPYGMDELKEVLRKVIYS